MVRSLRRSAVALVVCLTFPGAAEGQLQLTNSWSSTSSVFVDLNYTGDPSCSTTFFSEAYTWCEGAFEGNNLGNSDPGEADVLQFIENEAGEDQNGWLSNPFRIDGVGEDDYSGPAAGPLSFGAIYQDFVLALKAGNYFSLYYFAVPVESLTFHLPDGTAALSHWTVYGGDETTVTVPEPGILFLLSAGLLALGIRRRRLSA